MSGDHGYVARLLREMFRDAPWHGPAFLETVSDLAAAQAASRPIAGAHSIWEIVLHVTAWLRIVHGRLLGANDAVSPEQDWPPVRDTSPGAWRAALDELEDAEARLRELIARQDPGRFDEHAPGYQENLRRNAHGTIAHLAWHGGQIAILRRAMGLPATAPR